MWLGQATVSYGGSHEITDPLKGFVAPVIVHYFISLLTMWVHIMRVSLNILISIEINFWNHVQLVRKAIWRDAFLNPRVKVFWWQSSILNIKTGGRNILQYFCTQLHITFSWACTSNALSSFSILSFPFFPLYSLPSRPPSCTLSCPPSFFHSMPLTLSCSFSCPPSCALTCPPSFFFTPCPHFLLFFLLSSLYYVLRFPSHPPAHLYLPTLCIPSCPTYLHTWCMPSNTPGSLSLLYSLPSVYSRLPLTPLLPVALSTCCPPCSRLSCNPFIS